MWYREGFAQKPEGLYTVGHGPELEIAATVFYCPLDEIGIGSTVLGLCQNLVQSKVALQ
jgi:hypothetical protein